MHRSETLANASQTAALKMRSSPNYPVGIIEDEPAWRFRPRRAGEGSSVIATRWHALEERTQEVSAETAEDCHVVKIVLRSMNIRFSVSGHTVQDGIAMPGMLHVTEPAVAAHCLFRGPYDALHLYVPNSLITECSRDMNGGQTTGLCSESNLRQDPTAEQLGRALLKAEEIGDSYGQLYADYIGFAIVARLLASARRTVPMERPKVTGLAKWRLKRALDYIEARLAEPVSLADIASATGLTRMHFAAQFKAATGLRPHEYLLRRRIERAQQMLGRAEISVVNVALSVGFESQSHFTSVFKRFVGQPPHAWRKSRGYGRGCPATASG